MRAKAITTARWVLGAAALVLVLQAYLWPRFSGIRVMDAPCEFDRNHIVRNYWDDDLERYVEYSFSHRDLSESFLIQAAAWEALDERTPDEDDPQPPGGASGGAVEDRKEDKRKLLFVTASREFCKT